MKKTLFSVMLLAALIVTAACGSKSGNKVDDLLDSYEEYVDDYISYVDDNPGLESAAKAANLAKEANDLAKKLEDRKDELTEEQLKRLNKISAKLAEKIQEKSGLGSSFGESSSSDFGGGSEEISMFGSDSDNE